MESSDITASLWNEEEFFNNFEPSISGSNEGVTDSKVDEIYLSRHKEKILKAIVKRRKLEIIRKLIENPQNFVSNVSLALWIELISFATEKEFFEIFKELKKVEKVYEKIIKVDYKYKKVLDDISKLHSSIDANKVKKVQEFIQKYPKLKICKNSKNVSALERSIDASHFEIFLILLSEGFHFNEESLGQKLLNKVKEKRKEILKSPQLGKILKEIVKRNKLEILKILTENGEEFVANVSLDLWKELIDFAAENECFELFREFKKVEAIYERKLNEKVNYKYKNVLDDISQLHADISESEIFKIERFVQKYPKLKLCYGSSDFCALERSIDARQFFTYAFLRAKGFYSDKGQELKAKIEELEYDDKEKIRDEILKFTKPDPIGLILTKCDLDAASDVLNFQDIRQMLDELIKVEEIKPVLEILAQSDVKIIFDYNEESVVTIDPTADEFTLGLAYFRKGILYVGKNRSKAQRFGTFAHEATHFALFLLYENSCLPYREEDKERERFWVRIVQNIRRIYVRNPSGTDNIIKWVYECYSPGYQHNAELIVRVNDLLAFYHENPQKREEVRETFRELFDFYRNHVMPDLNMKNAYRIIKLNNDFELFEEIKSSNFQVKDSKNFDLLNLKKNALENFEGTSSAAQEIEQNIQNFLLLSDVPQLTLSKLLQEISKKSSNKLEAKVKNIFINFERLQQESLRKELEEILRNSESLKIIVNLRVFSSFDDAKVEESLEFFTKLKKSTQIFLVASSNFELVQRTLCKTFSVEDSKVEIENENFKISERLQKFDNAQSGVKFLKVDLKHSWNDLTKKSKGEILKIEIKFRGENLSLNELFSSNDPPSTEILKILSSKVKTSVKPESPKKLKNFIERKFLMKIIEKENEKGEKKFELIELSFDDLNDRTKEDKIVVISDLAGSGKTTLLHKVHENLNKKFQNFWVCFVSLLRNKEIVLDKKEISENFLDIMTDKILKLNELEKKIFELKYKNNQVVILFDGFDEISPDCKQNAIKIFKLHKQSQKSQIWITTRTHLEEDLEKELQVEAHKIEPLDEEEQIEFLCKFWEESCDDSNLREKCAEILVEKEMNRWRSQDLIGITLQIQILGEFFEGQLSDDFDEKLKNLNFFQVFEFLIEKSVKFKEEKNSLHDTLIRYMKTYETFALKLFLGETHHLFGRTVLTNELTDEELQDCIRGGIIFYDKDKKVFFTHLTYGEFLLSKFIKNQIKNFKENWKYKKDFFKLILEILSEEKFEVVKMFLDDAFKDLWKLFKTQNLSNLTEGEKNFHSNFSKFIREEKNLELYVKSLNFGLSSFSFSFLKFLDIKNKNKFEKILEICGKEDHENCELSKNQLLREVVRETKDSEILEEFIGDFFELYPENEKLFKFLNLKDEFSRTIFHYITDRSSPENFEVFWTKIEERKFEYEEIKTFFFGQDRWKNNLLVNFLSASRWEESDERINAAIEIIQRNLKAEDQQKLLTEKAFTRISCIIFERPLSRVLKFLNEICSPEKLLEGFSWTLLGAAWTSSREVLKIIFEEILELSKGNEEKVKEIFLGKDWVGENVLMEAARNDCESFFYILEEIFLKFLALTFEEIIFQVDSFGRNVLHHLAYIGNPKTAEKFFNRLETELSEKKLKNYLASKTKKSENVFHLIAERWRDDELKVFFDFYLKIFTEEEMKKILTEIDEKERTPLHIAAREKEDEYKYRPYHLVPLLELYESLFAKESILKFLAKKDKEGKNVFDYATKDKKKEILKKYL